MTQVKSKQERDDQAAAEEAQPAVGADLEEVKADAAKAGSAPGKTKKKKKKAKKKAAELDLDMDNDDASE